MSIFKAALAATVFILPVAAQADEADPDSIVVTANRQEQKLGEVAQSVTVISNEEITRRQSIALIDLLRTVPGVRIAANGGLGTQASVFVRGGNSSHTLALIDGVKVNDPSTPNGAFDFGSLTTGNIERIEIVRGSQSVLWGSQAIGGVVNVITREPTEALSADAGAEYGWRDTARAVANVSQKVGPVSFAVGGNYLRTDGFSALRDGAEKDGHRNYGANAKANVAFTDEISLDLRGWFSNSKTDIDGYDDDFNFIDTPDYARRKQWVAYAGLNVALFDGRLRNRFGYSFSQDRARTFTLPELTDTETSLAYDFKGRTERFEYQGIADIADMLSVTFGAETEKTRAISVSTGPFGSTFRESARQDSFYAQATVKPVAGLVLNGGVRHDDHDEFGGKTTFAASGVYSPNGGNTAIRAAYSEGFRTPSLSELYDGFSGNPDLRPESSKGWEAGVTQRLVDGRMEFGATWFERNTRNLVTYLLPFGPYENMDRARAKGLEATVTLRPTDGFTVQGAYSWVKSVNRETGLDLARRPRHSVSLLADYAWAFGLETGVTVTHVGESFDNASNTSRLEGYVLVDLRASLPLGDRFELFGRVENLLNERYETVANYGTAGRAGYVGARFKL